MIRNAASRSVVLFAGDIAERAYAIYIERDRADGFDREDWLRAERELNASPSIAPRKESARAGTRGATGSRSHDGHLLSTG